MLFYNICTKIVQENLYQSQYQISEIKWNIFVQNFYKICTNKFSSIFCQIITHIDVKYLYKNCTSGFVLISRLMSETKWNRFLQNFYKICTSEFALIFCATFTYIFVQYLYKKFTSRFVLFLVQMRKIVSRICTKFLQIMHKF